MQPAIDIEIPEGLFSDVGVCAVCRNAFIRERMTKRYCSKRCKCRAERYRRLMREKQ